MERTLEIPPGSRYAIAVTMPKSGDLVVDMPPGPGVKGIDEPGVLYTNNGTKDAPAVLGTVTIDPKYIAARDGFFTFPTQTLLKVTPDSGEGQTTVFEPGQNLDTYTSFVNTSVMEARGQARAQHRWWFRQQEGRQQRSQGLHLPVRRQHLPQHPVDPAAAELRRGVVVHQLQQRQPSDPHPCQRLSGAAGHQSAHRYDHRGAAVRHRQRERPSAGHRRERQPAGSCLDDVALRLHRIRGHVRGALSPA